MNSATQFIIYGLNVLHENIDNEVIVMNMDSGNYYSLTKVAASIWELVQQQASVAQIYQTIGQQYDVEADEVAAAIDVFLTELLDEALIRPVYGPLPALTTITDGHRLPFETPKLLKYDDMQDLLLLDPIHEVDDTGWPTKPVVLQA